MIRPCNDLSVIAGDATATAEFLAAIRQLDLLVVPIGGGGLLAGSLIVAEAVSPRTRVWAAEPAMADDAYRGWKSGRLVPSTHPPTMADELRGQVGPFAFSVLSNLVDDIVCVSESQIRAALAFLWFEAGMAVEPSSAVALAALMKCREQIRGKRVGIVLTGGNTDPAEVRALSDRAA